MAEHPQDVPAAQQDWQPGLERTFRTNIFGQFFMTKSGQDSSDQGSSRKRKSSSSS